MNNIIIDQKQLAILNEFDLSKTDYQLPNNLKISNNKLEITGIKSIDISAIRSNLSTSDFNSFAQVIDNLSRSYAGSSLLNLVYSLNQYFIITDSTEITIEGMSRLHEICCTNKVTHYHFGYARTLLTYWHEFNLPGVDDDFIDFISKLQLPKSKRPQGSPVRSDNPEEGWYTDNEYNLLVSCIWSSYDSGETPLHKATLLLLSAQYGRRPIQMSHLKLEDLKSDGESCGVSGNRIEFPGAKDSGSNSFRGSKVEVHPMGDDLWRLCQRQSNDTVNRFQACLGRKLETKERKLLPLFPVLDSREKRLLKKIKESKLVATNEADILSSIKLHQSLNGIKHIMSKGPAGLPLISERTGRTLVQNSYRNRYTRARQLARMDVPMTILQYWMGHETLRSLDAYYDDPAERARSLNEKIAPLMAPLAQAFQGTLRDKEADAVRGDNPASRIELDGRIELGVGTCGEQGFCSASVPIPCYRCNKFQPWVYGPHHEVKERLLERQELENSIPRTGQGRRLLVPVQLDKDIEAVELVITLCNIRQKDLKEENDNDLLL
jgi:hypothetical protein